jgi:hypothetical protein
MRFTGDAGFDRTQGFVLSQDSARPIEGLEVTRDPAGLCAAATFAQAGADPIEVRSTGRRGGFWIPMGSERRGPAMSAYDEFCGFHAAGGVEEEEGFGLAEHGTVRRLF